MLKLKRIMFVLRKTGAIKLFTSFLIFFILVALVLRLVEPNINTIFDSFWYCFIAFSTIDFGDIVATTVIGKIITVILSLYGILVTAMITGTIVSYYTEYLNNKQGDTISIFLEKLQNLPKLSKEELEDISENIKKLINNKK